MKMRETLEMLRLFKSANPEANKAEIQRYFLTECNPKKHRVVFVGDDFAIRFSEANKASFSNSALSLSALRKHDLLPVVICIVRPERLEFLLANSTLLKRISHTSQSLRIDNIVGTFNGGDIMRSYEGIHNSPEHFDELFAIHSEFSWEENLERLVEATNSIVGRSSRFDATDRALAELLSAPEKASLALSMPRFQAV